MGRTLKFSIQIFYCTGSCNGIYCSLKPVLRLLTIHNIHTSTINKVAEFSQTVKTFGFGDLKFSWHPG